MIRKHTKICSVPLVPTTVDLQVILNEVLGKYKTLPGTNRTIILNSAHTITSFRVFVINIIKNNLDWRIAIITNVVRHIHPENAGVCPSHLFASYIPEGVSEKLMKIALILYWFSVKYSEFPFFFIWVFFHEHLRITGLQGKGEGVSLTPHCHFHPLHRHLDISWMISAELLIASSRTNQ